MALSRNSFMPHMPGPQGPARRNTPRGGFRKYAPVALATLVVAGGIFSLPRIIALDVKLEEKVKAAKVQPSFPVTVDPAHKTITEDPRVNALIDQNRSTLNAAVGGAGEVLSWLASYISELPAYGSLAASNAKIVTIPAGFREEQVALAFGKALGWTAAQRAAFIKNAHTKTPKLSEGEFTPGTYVVYSGESTSDVQFLLNDRFDQEIRSRYSSSTESQVPLTDALTIASLLEREAGGWDDMREISGIMWNRLFHNMNLQIDATLQYAKANATTGKQGIWWPTPKPADKYIVSAYNTYKHAGLPPGPIANPSVAAVLAALNPKDTDCLFYFHDSHGKFHCSPTYAGHVALLKQYYGQGK